MRASGVLTREAQNDQLARFFDGQAADHCLIEQGVNRCIRANAKRKGHDRCSGKCGRLAQQSQRVAKILEYISHQEFLTRTSMPPWDRPSLRGGRECS